mmetsp:Transcript_28482/g.81787  ORF Transcript_28482/g.81787 Transcript_28482/m.81787 type:complete len:644 (+) Transcript_28482:498-2429(+)
MTRRVDGHMVHSVQQIRAKAHQEHGHIHPPMQDGQLKGSEPHPRPSGTQLRFSPWEKGRSDVWRDRDLCVQAHGKTLVGAEHLQNLQASQADGQEDHVQRHARKAGLFGVPRICVRHFPHGRRSSHGRTGVGQQLHGPGLLQEGREVHRPDVVERRGELAEGLLKLCNKLRTCQPVLLQERQETTLWPSQHPCEVSAAVDQSLESRVARQQGGDPILEADDRRTPEHLADSLIRAGIRPYDLADMGSAIQQGGRATNLAEQHCEPQRAELFGAALAACHCTSGHCIQSALALEQFRHDIRVAGQNREVHQAQPFPPFLHIAHIDARGTPRASMQLTAAGNLWVNTEQQQVLNDIQMPPQQRQLHGPSRQRDVPLRIERQNELCSAGQVCARVEQQPQGVRISSVSGEEHRCRRHLGLTQARLRGRARQVEIHIGSAAVNLQVVIPLERRTQLQECIELVGEARAANHVLHLLTHDQVKHLRCGCLVAKHLRQLQPTDRLALPRPTGDAERYAEAHEESVNFLRPDIAQHQDMHRVDAHKVGAPHALAHNGGLCQRCSRPGRSENLQQVPQRENVQAESCSMQRPAEEALVEAGRAGIGAARAELRDQVLEAQHHGGEERREEVAFKVEALVDACNLTRGGLQQ